MADVQLTAALDPSGVSAGTAKMSADVKAFVRGASGEFQKLDAETKKIGSGRGRGGNIAGGLGLQLQDVVVQAQAGAKATTIIAQQGSQILSIFGPMGAVAGTVVALGAAMWGVMNATDDAAKKAEEFDNALKASLQTAEKLRAETEKMQGQMRLSIFTRTRGKDEAEQIEERIAYEAKINDLQNKRLAIQEKIRGADFGVKMGAMFQDPEQQQREIAALKTFYAELDAVKEAIKATTDAYEEQGKARKEAAAKAGQAEADRIKDLEKQAKEARDSSRPMTRERLTELDRDFRRISGEQKGLSGEDFAKKELEKQKALADLNKGADELAARNKRSITQEMDRQIKKENEQAKNAQKIGGIIEDAQKEALRTLEQQSRELADQLKTAEDIARTREKAQGDELLNSALNSDAIKAAEKQKKKDDRAIDKEINKRIDEEDREERRLGRRGGTTGLSKEQKEERRRELRELADKTRAGRNDGVKFAAGEVTTLADKIAAAVLATMPK